MGRPTIEWEKLTYFEKGKENKLIDYPHIQLVGISSKIRRDIEKKKVKIKALEESIKKEKQKLNSEILVLSGKKKEVDYVLVEKSKDETNKGITILRGDKWIRGKVRVMGKSRFVHIGSVNKWGNKSDEELYQKIKEKVGEHLTKPLKK
jgi:hypothetical protein